MCCGKSNNNNQSNQIKAKTLETGTILELKSGKYEIKEKNGVKKAIKLK
ncbi:MAG: hypothetical protein IT276_14875 [Ignavibacteriaceae bacterium]|nr:hypothetical protein [Ignavibacteriaceae bacterium]